MSRSTISTFQLFAMFPQFIEYARQRCRTTITPEYACDLLALLSAAKGNGK